MIIKKIIKNIPGTQATWRFLQAQYLTRRDTLRCQRALAQRKEKSIDSSRILAFWGSDYADLTSYYRMRNASSLWHFIAEGYSLLPLDLSAMRYINAMGLQSLLKGDVLPEEEALSFFTDASELWSNWIAACGAYAEYDGVNWLREDHASLRWSIKGACYAARMAKALSRRGTKKFTYTTYSSKRSGPYYYRSDVCAHVWGALLESSAVPLVMPCQSVEPPASFVKPMVTRSFEGNILVTVNSGEMARFFPFVTSLAQTFPQQVSLCFFGQDKKIQTLWQNRTTLPVIGMPFPGPVEGNMFEDFLTHSRSFFENLEWGAGFDWFLRYQTHTRWPTLCRWFGAWKECLAYWQGHSVVGSFLEDLESKIPLAAASMIGKNAYYIPHGFMHIPEPWSTGWPPATMLCHTVLQKKCIEEALPHLDTRICTQIDLKEEYPTDICEPIKNNEMNILNILVILGSSCIDDTIIPYYGDKEQIFSLRIMSNIPKLLMDKVDIKFKVHPNYSDKEFFSFLKIDDLLIPVNSKLEYSIENSDIIVMHNYWGAPCFFGMEMKKPILFLMTSEFIFKGDIYPSYYLNKFYEHNLWIHRKIEDFWNIVLRPVNNDIFKKSILYNQNEFYDKYIKIKETTDLKKIFL